MKNASLSTRKITQFDITTPKGLNINPSDDKKRTDIPVVEIFINLFK